jgi:alkanesulfonate monooxygenase SsuD/methylene tetrahydromethanopterin reductase-like flavin-dependent oxidoreductase (luciferase family)
VRHGVVILPDQTWATGGDRWRLADELGFDHAWTYDHLMWRSLRNKPWFSSIPTLTAAATCTSRMRLGTLVASPALRDPVTLAKDMMTLDDISGGRMICGIGAGAGEFDETAFGGAVLDPGTRTARFHEFVKLTGQLLEQRQTSFKGTHFGAHEVHMEPGCVQRPRLPIAVAAQGPRGMRLAAAHAEMWVTAGWAGWGQPTHFSEVGDALAKQVEAVDASCQLENRDPLTLRRAVVTGALIDGVADSVETYHDAIALFTDLGFTDMIIHWPRSSPPYEGDVVVVCDIARSLIDREVSKW